MLFDLLRGVEPDSGFPSESIQPAELSDIARALFRAASIGVWIYDAATDTLHADGVVHDNLGRPPGTLNKIASWTELVHPEDLERVSARELQPITAEQIIPDVFRVLRPDGEIRHIRSWSMAYHNAQGEVRFVLGIDRDITSMQRLTEEFAEAETRFSGLAANVPGAIFRYIIHPDGSDEIEYMSPGCESIWEVSAEAIRGDPSVLWAMIHDDDLPAMQASVIDSAETLAPWVHRWRITTPSGQIKWLEGRGTPLRPASGGTIWNSLILDVSREMRANEELERHNARLSQAERLEALGQLVGGVAHDFNNILMVILGNLELLQSRATSPEDAEFLEEAVKATSRGADLTRQLLAVGRRSQLEPRALVVDRVLAETAAMLARVLPQSIELVTRATADRATVQADMSGLQNALLNLAINARDAMDGQGQLTIEAATVDITQENQADGLAEGRYVVLSLRDTGHGMSPEVRSRAFEPFFSTKHPTEGSGLGLSSVLGFCKQSGGTCLIESENGAGTEVRILLPADGDTEE